MENYFDIIPSDVLNLVLIRLKFVEMYNLTKSFNLGINYEELFRLNCSSKFGLYSKVIKDFSTDFKSLNVNLWEAAYYSCLSGLDGENIIGYSVSGFYKYQYMYNFLRENGFILPKEADIEYTLKLFNEEVTITAENGIPFWVFFFANLKYADFTLEDLMTLSEIPNAQILVDHFVDNDPYFKSLSQGEYDIEELAGDALESYEPFITDTGSKQFFLYLIQKGLLSNITWIIIYAIFHNLKNVFDTITDSKYFKEINIFDVLYELEDHVEIGKEFYYYLEKFEKLSNDPEITERISDFKSAAEAF